MENTCVRCGTKLQNGKWYRFISPAEEEIDCICDDCYASFRKWFEAEETDMTVKHDGVESSSLRSAGEEELKNKIDDIVDDCIEWEESWDGEEESAYKSLDKPSFKDQIFNLIQEQLSLAREEGKKEVVEKIRNAIKEDLKIEDIEKRHIKIDDDIVNILNDKGIKEMFLKDYEHGDIDNITNEDYELYKGWGFYS